MLRQILILLLCNVMIGNSIAGENKAGELCLTDTQFVSFSTMVDINEDLEKINYVDENFLNKTKHWNVYKKFIDNVSKKEKKHYCDKQIRQESMYFNQELVLVKTFRISGGLIKSQYYKKGRLYLALTSTAHNGVFDIKQYFHNGMILYQEYMNGINDNNTAPRWHHVKL